MEYHSTSAEVRRRTPIAAGITTMLTQIAEFNSEVIGATANADLEAAVDKIIETAKEETPTPVLEVLAKPEIDPATIFEFIPVKNNPGRYRLISAKLRQFINESMCVGIIDDRMLEQVADTQEQRDLRTNLSVVGLERFYMTFPDFRDIDQEDINLSASGLTFDEYKIFLADLTQRREVAQELARVEAEAKLNAHLALFSSGSFGFEDLCVGMRHESVKGVPYIFKNDQQDIAGKLISARRQDSMFGPYLNLSFQLYSNNGEGLNKVTHTITIRGFGENQSLADLDLEKLDINSERTKRLIARGEAYLNLTKKPTYVASKGNMTRKQGRNLEIINAVGRVMVDIEGMGSIDTNFYGYFCKAEEDTTVIPEEAILAGGDEIKLACVPYVYGFSFKAKRWGQLNVSDLAAIEFRKDAYEMLVLDQETKDLIFASVTDQSSDNDIIAGKGGGSINLLEGPPGVGKTLTAEAVAEKLQKPLYMVSTGELGTTVNQLEESLKEILEIAESWGAVLLIDEADIFLETRDKHDVQRNAMVAVFLRLLEYYQGVMFLTTNRADNLDPAFESRITLCIHYTELSHSSRLQVWTNLLKAAKLGNAFNTEAIDKLAAHKLNGRQIKGIIKSARSLSDFQGKNLNSGHFEAVIKQKADFKAATVFKLGAGLDNHNVEAVQKPGLIKRLYDAIFGVN